MTATLDAMAASKKDKPEPTAEQKLAEELVARAREQGVSLTGPDGLLKQLTKTVLETALNQEMTEHLGHEKNRPAVNEAGNVRNGTRAKTVLTEGTGEVGIEVPRDREGTFEPQIVRKRQRRLSGVDDAVQAPSPGHGHVVGGGEPLRGEVAFGERVAGAEDGHHVVGADGLGGDLGA
jgi:putative transposase